MEQTVGDILPYSLHSHYIPCLVCVPIALHFPTICLPHAYLVHCPHHALPPSPCLPSCPSFPLPLDSVSVGGRGLCLCAFLPVWLAAFPNQLREWGGRKNKQEVEAGGMTVLFCGRWGDSGPQPQKHPAAFSHIVCVDSDIVGVVSQTFPTVPIPCVFSCVYI